MNCTRENSLELNQIENEIVNEIVSEKTMITFVRQVLTLARISNLPTVWTNVSVAWAVNATASDSFKIMPEFGGLGFFDFEIFVFLITGASLVYAGGCTLNDAFDQEFDRVHNPTRPLSHGSISPQTVWILGFFELLVGAILLINLAGCEKNWVIALLISVIFYDYIHKKWIGGIVVMGTCRLFLWLTAASAGNNTELAPQTWIWGIALTAYIIGISLFARGESKKEEFSSRYSILLLFSSPLLALAFLIYWNQLDPIRVFLCNATGLLIAWIAFSSIILMKEEKKGAIGSGVSRLLAGICALDATAVSLYVPILIAPVLCCLSIAVLLQKKFAAT